MGKPASISTVRFESKVRILTPKPIYESWHPLSASPRIYSEVPLPFEYGYEAIHEERGTVGLMGLVYADEAYARVEGAVDPNARGKGIGGTLLKALLKDIPSNLTVIVQPADGRTSAPALLSRSGFLCQDAGVVETFLHDLTIHLYRPTIPAGYELSTVFKVAQHDIEQVIDLETVWCVERDQPVGPRLLRDYTGSLEGFVVLARDQDGDVVGLANAELTNVEGLGKTELLVVDPAHRGRGIGRALKRAQLESAKRFGWSQLLATVPEADHPAARINAELGGLGIDGLKWIRPALS